MGFGDDVITTSVVKRAFQRVNRPVCVGDGVVRWSEVFENNPKITKDTKDAIWVRTIKGNRPYIDYQKTTATRTAYLKDYKVEPGEIYLSDKERRWKDEGFIYIEPNVKGSFSGNKDWGFDNWQMVVNEISVPFVQGQGKKLSGVAQRDTRSFRDACALLSRADLFVGTDGGLHHAAAALGIPAVVVWGGLTSPRNLGYDAHINLHAGSEPCGTHAACEHCRRELSKIKPDMVVDAIRRALQAGGPEETEGLDGDRYAFG